MRVSARDPRWKVGSAVDVAQLAANVSQAAASLKQLIEQASEIQAGIEKQMGGSFAGMGKLIRPMRMLEESSEKLDEAAWAFQDFSAKFRKVSL